MKPPLSGFNRFIIVKHWNKIGKPGDKEEFIRKVCDQKGWQYTPAIKIVRVI